MVRWYRLKQLPGLLDCQWCGYGDHHDRYQCFKRYDDTTGSCQYSFSVAETFGQEKWSPVALPPLPFAKARQLALGRSWGFPWKPSPAILSDGFCQTNLQLAMFRAEPELLVLIRTSEKKYPICSFSFPFVFLCFCNITTSLNLLYFYFSDCFLNF